MESKEILTVKREWNNTEIKVAIDKDGVRIECPVGKFIDQLKNDLVKNLPKPHFMSMMKLDEFKASLMENLPKKGMFSKLQPEDIIAALDKSWELIDSTIKDDLLKQSSDGVVNALQMAWDGMITQMKNETKKVV